ncbi:TIGR02680 family protein [Nonomuraea jiangxiensis]|uniref:TIGR02680 family protein n=1 Tax=Nonomuraea jiangxiensis TaxID=633440 RepID=A0A1G8VZK4_9ACTN|nr:TIGR02680 family protein [Nonomuraea jiangxiensis]SDJ71534.1 TIGR02680 family protein [Nonomuraea jiangxiensis]
MTVTEPSPTRAAQGMDQRWTPVRAGIMNVWRYYDEVFEFHRGRLLLRGPNGSGKSKVLELLLPYVLDASLKPSRLSTFGGTERTMHWNLMGDGAGGTTRVGYVWLEFRHADGRWFTCGARLQATIHTKTVTATYFTTECRVDAPDGIRLSGDGGQPLSKAQLIDELGASGKVHESAEAYRTVVRQTLYRALNEQRYDSLLTALRQLRTPKLSERLDPGLLSDLLSSALPPLGEGEIHEIAEGFERLDRQREELRLLDRDVEEAERLATRQRGYAQRVLRAAAAAVTSAGYTMDSLAAEAKAKREALKEADEELQEATVRLGEEEAQELALAAQIDGLKESDAYRAGGELHRLRTEAATAHEGAARLRDQAGVAARSAGAKQELSAHAAADARTAARLADRARTEARQAAERAGLLGVHEESERAASAPAPDTTADGQDGTGDTADGGRDAGRNAADGGRDSGKNAANGGRDAGRNAAGGGRGGEEGVHRARELLRAAVISRAAQVREVRVAAVAHDEAIDRRTVAEQDRDRARDDLAAAQTAHDQAERLRDEQLRNLAAALEEWAAGCVQLRLDPEELAGAADRFEEADELVGNARTAAAVQLAAREQHLTGLRESLLAERAELAGEREGLNDQTLLEPPASHTRDPAARQGRPGAPLWRSVAFRSGLDPVAQAGVEAALEAAGLLDLWLRPDGGFDPGEHDAFAVAALSRPAPGYSLAHVLFTEADAPVDADAVLSGIAFAPSAIGVDHPAAIGADGTWRLGPAAGRWVKAEPSYIGATARERARRRRIAELDDLLGELAGRIAECDHLLAVAAGDRDTLAAELRRRPDRKPYAEAVRALDSAVKRVALLDDQLRVCEQRLHEREKAVGRSLRRLTELAAAHALPTAHTALDNLDEALRTAETTGTVWHDRRADARAAAERAGHAAETALEYQELAVSAVERAEEAASAAVVLAEKLAAVESTVGVEHLRVLERLQQAQSAYQACRRLIKSVNDGLARLNAQLGQLKGELGIAEDRHAEAGRVRDEVSDRFRRLAAGYLPVDARVTVELAAGAGVRAVLESARAVAEQLAAVPYEHKNVREAEARLQDAFHHAREVLADRADLELAPDEDVQVLTATVNGVRAGAAALSAALRKERDDRRSDITEAERDLFDRTLAGDTRRHLADRIRQATALVEGMNQRLERVRTASRVAVRLVWQVDATQSPGTRAARDLLLRDPAGLSAADKEALYVFFRDRVEEARADNSSASWEDQLMKVLDYTSWHRFTVKLDRGDGQGWQDLTRKLHGALSGGEKAIALHLPLFAAVAAHYQTDPGCPRFILLDEVFVGVDRTNRGQVFDLLVDLGLDLVLTSDHEWCEYRELDGIAIHQLITGDGDDAVTTARFVWNGYRTVPTE